MIAQAGIFNPLFIILPLLGLLGLAGLLCLPLLFLSSKRSRRIREIEAESRVALTQRLAELAESSNDGSRSKNA